MFNIQEKEKREEKAKRRRRRSLSIGRIAIGEGGYQLGRRGRVATIEEKKEGGNNKREIERSNGGGGERGRGRSKVNER